MLETIVGVFFAIAAIATVVATLLMLIGAKVAGVENATFGRALLASIACSFLTWIISAVMSVIPIVGTILGFLIGLGLSLLAIQAIFQTSFGKALVTWIFHGVAQVAAIILAIVVGGASIAAALGL